MKSNQLTKTFTVEDIDYDMQAIIEEYDKWHPKYYEHAQGRTNFQIEKFIGMEDGGVGCIANTYVNLLYQTRVMRGELKNDIKRGIEIQRNFAMLWGEHFDKNSPIQIKDENGNPKFIWYDLEKMEHDHSLKELEMSAKDKLQQLEYFVKMLEKLEEINGGPITREQYEEEAPLYWEKRFERQSLDAILSSMTGIGTGDLKSIRQAIAKPIVDGSNNVITNDSAVGKMLSGNFDVKALVQESNETIAKLYSEAPKQIESSKPAQIQKDEYELGPEALKNLGISITD